MRAPPLAREHQLVEGPDRVRNELVWRLDLGADGPAVLGQLLPELAAEESLRRRYAYELDKLEARRAPRLAPLLAVGPAPDPRDPNAEPPWRLRADPPGRSLEAWLEERAPAPIDEALALGAELAEAVHGCHAEGWVVRDLEPRSVTLDAGDGRPWLTDVGLARLHILTTRTASSLMLESSVYAAPEHVRATLVDPRADVYSIGVILWRALTGTLPFGDRHALLREQAALPPLEELRREIGKRAAELVRACLADDPEARPESAGELAELLRGEGEVRALSLERATCQACGEPMRPGLRLCLACGREAVQLHHLDSPKRHYGVYLRRAKEDAAFHAELRDFFDTFAEDEPASLEFIVGHPRMYSKAERKRRHALPAKLFDEIDEETARALSTELQKRGMKTQTRKLRRGGRRLGAGLFWGSLALLVAGPMLMGAGALVAGLVALTAALPVFVVGAVTRARAVASAKRPLARLRKAPAALPASDPLVARLAALLDGEPRGDVRERVSELALLVQRLVDRRAELAEAGELDAVAEPVEPLVAVIERHAAALAELDAALAELDEGALVRALAASEARREPRSERAPMLEALDRLRHIEDRRTAHMERLLEASSLLRRTVELALKCRDEAELDRAMARLAEAELEGELS